MNEQLPNAPTPNFITAHVNRRRDLLPLWIKFFVWFFFISIAAIPMAFIFAALGKPFTISLLGLSSAKPFSAMGLFLLALYAIKGVISYGLWTEKGWVITLAQADAVFSLAVCCFAMVYNMMVLHSLSLRFELIIIVFYFVKLRDIANDWKNFYSEQAAAPSSDTKGNLLGNL